MQTESTQKTSVAGSGVIHSPENGKFYTTVDGRTSYVSYRRDDSAMDLQHTYVPVEDRGQGIAEEVVKAALAYADSQELQVIPSCSYVSKYVARHKEWQHLLDDEGMLD